LPDGRRSGTDDLRRALVDRPDHQFVQAFTENLMTYALAEASTIATCPRFAASSSGRGRQLPLQVDRPGVVSSDAFRKRKSKAATGAGEDASIR
jgi:hypothetical protein